MTIGLRLRDERVRLRMSQTELAVAVGISKNTQLGYEKGERNPDAGYLIAVAALGIDVNFVLFGKATPSASDSLSELELEIVGNLRVMHEENQKSLRRIASALARSDTI